MTGLDESVTLKELKEAIAREGGCAEREISLGEEHLSPGGMRGILVRCPTWAARKLAEKGKLKICKSNFKEEEVCSGKTLLFRSVGKADQMPSRPRDGTEKSLQDIVTLLKKLDWTTSISTAPIEPNNLLRPVIPMTLLYVFRLHYTMKAEEIAEYLRTKTNLTLRVARLESRQDREFIALNSNKEMDALLIVGAVPSESCTRTRRGLICEGSGYSGCINTRQTWASPDD
ncbi:unnamed protein product [Chilo suppressalis]|uniref:BRCT domain-containing protein n=1 Tax=Chilo suppressalis TaxID=168631 RepID=A0ABN8AYF5_CHISP|nr:unnamed protein product [Chilo suppressalis]